MQPVAVADHPQETLLLCSPGNVPRRRFKRAACEPDRQRWQGTLALFALAIAARLVLIDTRDAAPGNASLPTRS